MTRRNVLTIILDSIFVVAFNILFFMNIGSLHDTSIWICYGFLHFAYFMVLLTPVMEANGKNAYLAKLTTYAISLLYFIIEVVLAIFVVLYELQNGDSLEIKFVISIQTILTAIYLIILVSNLFANNATAIKEAEHDAQNGFIKTMSSKAKYIESIAEPSLKDKIYDLYCTIHSSPIKTFADVSVYEENIENLFNELEEFVNHNNEQKTIEKIREIERLINKRNFMLKARR